MTAKIAILGAGPGGYVAAIRAAKMGADVSLIEKVSVGGTCLNHGCIPSKVIKTTADLLDRLRRSDEFGIRLTGEASPDMKKLMFRKESVIQTQAKGILNLLKHNKIKYIQGNGKITSPNKIEITLDNNETCEIIWDKLVLATGSKPYQIDGIPFDGKRILSSNHALELQKVPKSLVIVGGGVIGCEFAFIFSSLGSNVTLVEGMSRLLPMPSVDEECSRIIAREMKKRKINVLLDSTVKSVEHCQEYTRLSIGESPFSTRKNKKTASPKVVEAEKALICVGRLPNTKGIGFEELGGAIDSQGWIITNDKMQTTVNDVFAIGDVLGPSKMMLAHVASTEGSVAAENAMGGNKSMRYDVVPGAVFTTPEVANVGLTEKQAKEKYGAAKVDNVLFRHIGKAHVIGEIAGQVKIVSEKNNGKIVGVHIVGPHAADLIAEGVIAVKQQCTVTELAETIHAHPTLSEAMMEAAMKAAGMEVHG
jgi:dihydrolipoyl dehydrogenase